MTRAGVRCYRGPSTEIVLSGDILFRIKSPNQRIAAHPHKSFWKTAALDDEAWMSESIAHQYVDAKSLETGVRSGRASVSARASALCRRAGAVMGRAQYLLWSGTRCCR